MRDKISLQTSAKTKTKWPKLIAVLMVGLLLGGASTWFYFSQRDSDITDGGDVNGGSVSITNFDECIAAGYPAMESYPRQCTDGNGETFVEELVGAVQFNSENGVLITLNDFQANKHISSPLTITGEVPGSWSFEAVFVAVLTDWDGRIIAEGQAQLTDDWMTDELVPFEVTLEFEKPTYKNTGALILKKDNPSDLPENDDALEVPVVYD